MSSLSEGWKIQTRVIGALMIRELITRFGRENIGFLWMMVEPLLFASLVGIMWTVTKGASEHGIGVMAFVITGYLPMVLFRSSVNRGVQVFTVNGSLMYHRQIKILDFVFVRFLIEFIGHTMAYAFIAVFLIIVGLFPVPTNIGLFLIGWTIYGFFVLALCSVIAPLSEMSEVLEKFIPVTTYIMIPLSGSFFMMSWVTPRAREVLLYSPPVHGMEIMRSGIFGHDVQPYYDFFYPIAFSAVMFAVGLLLCRRVRRNLVIE